MAPVAERYTSWKQIVADTGNSEPCTPSLGSTQAAYSRTCWLIQTGIFMAREVWVCQDGAASLNSHPFHRASGSIILCTDLIASRVRFQGAWFAMRMETSSERR